MITSGVQVLITKPKNIKKQHRSLSGNPRGAFFITYKFMKEYEYKVKITFKGLFKIYAENEQEAIRDIKNFDLYELNAQSPSIEYNIKKKKQ